MFLAEMLFLAFFYGSTSWAQHGPGASNAEPPKAEDPAAAVTTEEWIELSNRVMNMRAKVGMKKDALRKLIEEKRTEKNPTRVAEIIKQMVEEHKGLQKEVFEFNQQSSILKFRFPEKAMANDKRKYERMEIDSLEQIETQLSLDAKIKKVVAKTRRHFSQPEITALPKEPLPQPEKVKPADTSSQDYLKEPVVIEK